MTDILLGQGLPNPNDILLQDQSSTYWPCSATSWSEAPKITSLCSWVVGTSLALVATGLPLPVNELAYANPSKAPRSDVSWTQSLQLSIPVGNQNWQQTKAGPKNQPSWVGGSVPSDTVTYLPCSATEWSTSGFKTTDRSWVAIPPPVAAVAPFIPYNQDNQQKAKQSNVDWVNFNLSSLSVTPFASFDQVNPRKATQSNVDWVTIPSPVAVVPLPDGKQEWQQPKPSSKYRSSWEGIPAPAAVVDIPYGKQEWQQPKPSSKYQSSWALASQPIATNYLPSAATEFSTSGFKQPGQSWAALPQLTSAVQLPDGKQEWQQPKPSSKYQSSWALASQPIATNYMPSSATEFSTSGPKKPGQSWVAIPPPVAVAVTALPDGDQNWQSPQHSLRTKTGQSWVTPPQIEQFVFREPLIAQRHPVKYNRGINSWTGQPQSVDAVVVNYMPSSATEWATSGFKKPGYSWSNLLPPPPAVPLPDGKQEWQQPKPSSKYRSSWEGIPPPVVGPVVPLPDGKQEWQQPKPGHKDQPSWALASQPIPTNYMPSSATEFSTSGFKKPGQSWVTIPPPVAAVVTALPAGKQDYQAPQHSLRTKTGQSWFGLPQIEQFVPREPIIAQRWKLKYNQSINSWTGSPQIEASVVVTYLPSSATEFSTSGPKKPGQSWVTLPLPVALVTIPDGKQDWQQTKGPLPVGSTYVSNTSALTIPPNVKPQTTTYDWPLPVLRIYPKGQNSYSYFNPNVNPPTPPPPATDDHYLPFFSTVGKMRSF